MSPRLLTSTAGIVLPTRTVPANRSWLPVAQPMPIIVLPTHPHTGNKPTVGLCEATTCIAFMTCNFHHNKKNNNELVFFLCGPPQPLWKPMVHKHTHEREREHTHMRERERKTLKHYHDCTTKPAARRNASLSVNLSQRPCSILPVRLHTFAYLTNFNHLTCSQYSVEL